MQLLHFPRRLIKYGRFYLTDGQINHSLERINYYRPLVIALPLYYIRVLFPLPVHMCTHVCERGRENALHTLHQMGHIKCTTLRK